MSTLRDADVIVVGAGTGGLTAAAYLAVAGRQVVVVDRGETPGGMATVFAHGDYEFDVGLHFLPSDHRGTPMTQPMLDPLGIEVRYRRLDPIDTIVLPDGRFEVPTGMEAYRERLHDALPGERRAIDRYLEIIDELDAEVMALQRVHGLSDVPSALWRSRGVLRHRRTTLGELFDRLRLSPRARTLLAWIDGVYAVAPSEASLLLHAVVTRRYLDGSWYPTGGGQVISDRLAEVVRQHGGRLLLGHEVTRIVVRDGEAAGVMVRDADGAESELAAPVVVSAADLKHTYLELLDPAVVPIRTRRRVRGYEMPLPLAVVYAVIDRDLVAEGVPATNFLVAAHDDVEGFYRSLQRGEFVRDPFTWISSPTLKERGEHRSCLPGQTNLQLMTVAPAQLRSWGLQVGVERGASYQAAKRQLRDRLFATAERALPGLEEAVVFDEVATPYTFHRYMGVTDGTSYGIASTPDQVGLRRPGPKTSIRGLYLAGASTRSGHGIGGAMAGGIDAASAVLGRSAVSEARAARRAAEVVTAA
jgi:all-trans-retinol 13,14-reductase